MSLGSCFLAVLLRLGAGRMEEGPSDVAEGPRLMMESGCGGYGTEGDILDRGVFRMYCPCRFLRKMAEEGRHGFRINTANT